MLWASSKRWLYSLFCPKSLFFGRWNLFILTLSGKLGEIVNTKTITTGFVALLMIIMALAPSIINVEELNDNSTTGYDHGGGGTPDGTAMLGGILTWQDDAWNSTWTCEGGLALVTPMDWQLFVDSDDNETNQTDESSCEAANNIWNEATCSIQEFTKK